MIFEILKIDRKMQISGQTGAVLVRSGNMELWIPRDMCLQYGISWSSLREGQVIRP